MLKKILLILALTSTSIFLILFFVYDYLCPVLIVLICPYTIVRKIQRYEKYNMTKKIFDPMYDIKFKKAKEEEQFLKECQDDKYFEELIDKNKKNK